MSRVLIVDAVDGKIRFTVDGLDVTNEYSVSIPTPEMAAAGVGARVEMLCDVEFTEAGRVQVERDSARFT